MNNFQFHPEALRAVPELKHAARISGCQDVDLCLVNLMHFSIENFHSQFVLLDVVNAGTTATLIRTLDFNELESGNRLQQFSRFVSDSLAMNQVAWIVVPHTARQWFF